MYVVESLCVDTQVFEVWTSRECEYGASSISIFIAAAQGYRQAHL